jgi:putative membrane protein
VKIDHQELERRVAALEAGSAVELVVVSQPQAGSYADVDLRWGCVFALLFLVVALHSEIVFHPDFMVVNTVISGVVGWACSRHFPALRRLLTTSTRRDKQLREYAQMAFCQLEISHTRDRSGMLLLLAELERAALLLVDLGVTARVPQAVLDAARQRLTENPSAVLSVLDDLARDLAELWPAPEGDTDELSNAVRTLS